MSETARFPMASAPRNGLSIVLGHEDCGEFVMHWEPTAENALLPGRMGLWVSLDRSFTWSEHDGAGPGYWRPLPTE